MIPIQLLVLAGFYLGTIFSKWFLFKLGRSSFNFNGKSGFFLAIFSPFWHLFFPRSLSQDSLSKKLHLKEKCVMIEISGGITLALLSLYIGEKIAKFGTTYILEYALITIFILYALSISVKEILYEFIEIKDALVFATTSLFINILVALVGVIFLIAGEQFYKMSLGGLDNILTGLIIFFVISLFWKIGVLKDNYEYVFLGVAITTGLSRFVLLLVVSLLLLLLEMLFFGKERRFGILHIVIISMLLALVLI